MCCFFHFIKITGILNSLFVISCLVTIPFYDYKAMLSTCNCEIVQTCKYKIISHTRNYMIMILSGSHKVTLYILITRLKTVQMLAV